MAVTRTKSAWVALAAVITVFAGLVVGLTWRLRGELRSRVLQREAEAIRSVVLMQLASEEARQPELAEIGMPTDVFTAVLESSRWRGVLGVQLFDRAGALQAALPETNVGDADLEWLLQAAAKGAPLARFVARGNPTAITRPAVAGSSAPGVPLLELAVPLSLRSADSSTTAQVAHYWIDGAPVAREFALMDRGLAVQSGVAFLAGAIVIAGVLLWAFHRVDQANRKLRAQSADLVRANQELAFSARTAAIGAISAHLFHGLKNPLAGLEGFVTDGPSAAADPVNEGSWRAAMETTRRLREMVNEVLAVLQDENAGTSEYAQPAEDVVAAVRQKVQPLASHAGVAVDLVTSSPVELSGRTANLAGLILVNLVTNAIEATPRGGHVELDVGDHDGIVEFHVRDQGAGLTEAVRSNLFQPTISTKKTGGGIGLAISYQLARHAGGQLELVQSGARGTVFALRVPQFQTQTVTRN